MSRKLPAAERWQETKEGGNKSVRKKGFFTNPDNLNYNLRLIVPLLVLLTSLLALAIGSNILAPIKTKIV
ncbi:MAG TPA: hypothetical protein VHO84_00385, partial [Syntrophorhabdaceae bacterium]|nr:hypothetical protein [Syntrophorhabdaceae bacterium]